MKYMFNVKRIKRYETNNAFGFNEEVEYIDYISDDKKELMGELAQVIIEADRCEGDIEYYFKYSHPENKYNRGYMLVYPDCISNNNLEMIIKEVK